MASSIAAITILRSIDFSRATASAICSSSSLLALTAAIVLVSSGGIVFALSQFFCGEAVFLGIFWGVLFRFQLRLVALQRIGFLGMGRGWRFEAEALAHLTFRRLAAPHRFRDQLIGQDKPGLGDIFHHKRNFGGLAFARVIATQPHRITFDVAKKPAESLAPFMGDRHLDLD